jgi:hypothetical protein
MTEVGNGRKDDCPNWNGDSTAMCSTSVVPAARTNSRSNTTNTRSQPQSDSAIFRLDFEP